MPGHQPEASVSVVWEVLLALVSYAMKVPEAGRDFGKCDHLLNEEESHLIFLPTGPVSPGPRNPLGALLYSKVCSIPILILFHQDPCFP